MSNEHASVYLIVSSVYAYLLVYCLSHWGQKTDGKQLASPYALNCHPLSVTLLPEAIVDLVREVVPPHPSKP